ncbi:MAG: hypothetical protein ABSA30_11920 [Candidatus Aminicenantales bacterium]
MRAEEWLQLRARLQEIGLTEEYVGQITRVGERLLDIAVPPLRNWHARRRREPAAYALRMLMLGDPVTAEEAQFTIGKPLLEKLIEAGLIAWSEAGGLVSPFRMVIGNDLYIVCDDLMLGENAVMGAGDTTNTLCQASHPTRSIERMLDTKLATINTTIETKIADVVKTRGDELVNNAVKIAVQRTDELSRIYIEHNQNYSEPFDSSKFNEYLEANKDKGFRTIRQAYDAWVSPRAMEREVDKKVKEKLAAQSGPNVPGTTPAPATNTNIRHFMKRTGTGAAATETGASRAAAMLDRLEASRAQNVA